MDHLKALATKASERYLLGEMSEPERFAFEEHYFQCGECAEDIRAGAVFTQGIRSVGRDFSPRREKAPVRQGWLSWLSMPVLPASAAAAVLACVVGYQALVIIPGWRESRALAPVVLRAAARGEEQTVVAAPGQRYSVLSLDVNASEPGSSLRYEMAPRGGSVRVRGSATAPPFGSPLLIVVSHSDLTPAGPWTLVLLTPEGKPISEYPFQLKTQ
jgi:hypothetical protein